jgi:hypothetical protein
MSDATSGGSPSPPTDSTRTSSGVTRGLGLVISTLTALAVAFVGNAVLPGGSRRAEGPSPGGVTGAAGAAAPAVAGAGAPSLVAEAGTASGAAANGTAAPAAGPGSTPPKPRPASPPLAAAPEADTPAPTAAPKDRGAAPSALVPGNAGSSAGSAGKPTAARLASDESQPAGRAHEPPAANPRPTSDGGGAAESEGHLVAGAGAGGLTAATASSTDAAKTGDAAFPEVPEAAKDAAKEPAENDKAEGKLSTAEDPTLPTPHTPPDCSLPDKDIARDAWRRNSPTLCKGTDGDRVSLFIPLKGTLDGETHELRQASHEVRINLPAGESLLTLRQYKVRRSGFKDLRILPTDSGGTRLRLKLQSGTGEPSFDMKDGYAKITITAPRSAAAAD